MQQEGHRTSRFRHLHVPLFFHEGPSIGTHLVVDEAKVQGDRVPPAEKFCFRLGQSMASGCPARYGKRAVHSERLVDLLAGFAKAEAGARLEEGRLYEEGRQLRIAKLQERLQEVADHKPSLQAPPRAKIPRAAGLQAVPRTSLPRGSKQAAATATSQKVQQQGYGERSMSAKQLEADLSPWEAFFEEITFAASDKARLLKFAIDEGVDCQDMQSRIDMQSFLDMAAEAGVEVKAGLSLKLLKRVTEPAGTG